MSAAGEGEGAATSSRRYAAARRAVDLLERCDAPPTPLNFELWLIYAADPTCPLGVELARIEAEGLPVTEELSEDLASRFLPRHKLSQEIHETGQELARQLEQVGRAMDAAQASNRSYGRTLAAGAQEFDHASDVGQLRRLTDHLMEATRRVERENAGLADMLSRSTQEVRRLREHMEQVRRDSLTDALTGLPNRKALDDAVRRACSDGAGFTLALIDIDHFKNFNDTWGHQTGDQVIRYVASVLGRLGAAPRMASRYGGEEFAVLFPSESEEQAARLLDEVRTQIASRVLKRRSTDEDLGSVSISIGVARRDGDEAGESVFGRADAALYASKRGGRNRVTRASALEAETLESRAA